MTNNDCVPELTNHEFEDFIKDEIVLINFFADWCMPCIMLNPFIDELYEKFKGKIKFGKVDLCDNKEIVKKFNITNIPNITILKQGIIQEQLTGSISPDELEEKLNQFL